MTNDIPEDVMEAARFAMKSVGWHADSCALGAARAIMAERERCAKVADAMPWQIDMSPAHVRGLKGSDVAKAIRSGQ